MRRLLLIGLGALLAVFLFGMIVQVTDTNDYGYTHTDPATGLKLYNKNGSFFVLGGCFENTVKINNLGFHGQDVPEQKGENVYRIIILGGSFIAAVQVQVEEMFSTVLQQKLNADNGRKYTYEVIPVAINGNKPFYNALYYLLYGSPLKPDLVINFETQWELSHFDGPEADLDAEGKAILEVPKINENPTRALVRDTLRRSKLLVNLYNRYLLFKDNVSGYLARPLFFLPESAVVLPQSEEQMAKEPAVHLQKQEASTLALANKVAEDRAKFLLATAYAPEAAPTVTQGELVARSASLAARAGAPYVDLQPRMTDLETAEGESATLSPCEGHWSVAGNRYAADALYEYLKAHPALITR